MHYTNKIFSYTIKLSTSGKNKTGITSPNTDFCILIQLFLYPICNVNKNLLQIFLNKIVLFGIMVNQDMYLGGITLVCNLNYKIFHF